MPNTIDQYREAKDAYLKLRSQAKKELISRFNELANELLRVQKELRDDFGVKISLPTKAKNSRPAKGSATPPAQQPPAPESPKVVALEKKVAAEKKKLDQAIASGKADKSIRDRIYELEDELRLAREK
jgi:hypothetical protein